MPEVFFAHLTDRDRGCIGALYYPREQVRPPALERVLELLKDGRNVPLIEEAMPHTFYGYMEGALRADPTLSATAVMSQFLQMQLREAAQMAGEDPR